MGMKEYNSENTEEILVTSKNSDRKVHINVRPTGRIGISSRLAGMYGIKEGDRLAFGQDSQYPQDWKVFRSSKGFTVHFRAGGHGRTAEIYSYGLAKAVIESTGKPFPGGVRFHAVIGKDGAIGIDSLHPEPLGESWARRKGKVADKKE